MRASRLLATLASRLALATARAEQPYVFVEAGSPLSVETGLGWHLDDQFALRASFGHLQPGASNERVAGVGEFRAHPVSTATINLLVDWFPRADSGFRLTGGATLMTRNTQNLVAMDGSSASATSGHVKFDKLEPYLGVGWESSRADKPGWRFISDLGLHFQTGARVSLGSAGGDEQPGARLDGHGQRWLLGERIGLGYSF